MGKTRAVAFGQDGPNASIGQLKGDFLAHERPSALDGHKLGGAIGLFGEHALDVVAVVYAHGVQNLLVVHALSPFPSRQNQYSNLVGWAVPQLATELCRCGLVPSAGAVGGFGEALALLEPVGAEQCLLAEAVQLVVGLGAGQAMLDAPDENGVAAVLAPQLCDACQAQYALRLAQVGLQT